jgi:hypothetical protein
MAHEFTHRKQAEKETLPDNAGETGSPYEDEANAMAGRIMRHWAEKHPEMFAHVPLEEASGYIPTKKQARDPRFVMALTRDVRPGAVGKEANKLGLQTDAQGRPQTARADGLFEDINKKSKRLNTEEDYSPDNPPGPESKPTMPAGTLRVDVSDVYDWYKLGQHISNMKGLGKHDFGAGPPSAIISFGDEDTEHKFIKDIKATGLDVTDIDPRDTKKRAGKTIKTDPTYNVAENALEESLRQELSLFEEQDLFEINMGSKNLRREAAKTGAIAGMEFEMIVPNVEGGGGDEDLEPDYDYDNVAVAYRTHTTFSMTVTGTVAAVAIACVTACATTIQNGWTKRFPRTGTAKVRNTLPNGSKTMWMNPNGIQMILKAMTVIKPWKNMPPMFMLILLVININQPTKSSAKKIKNHMTKVTGWMMQI